MSDQSPRAERTERLQAARLYLVCGAAGRDGDASGLPELLRESVAGGVEIFQLREKELPDEQLVALANAARALCERLGTLFIVNDRPVVAAEAGADGVHVGQDDLPVETVREIVGEQMLVGLSTHAPQEIDAVDPALVDYIGVGPVHATPTKPGRPAVGTELIRYAAAHATVPWFAIGGLNAQNLDEVLEAGAERVCVVRAIAEAGDPRAAAAELRGRLGRSSTAGPA
jgi:thiamine-phosphate pyrophosphorylase